jgi:hypothetical protein
MNTPSLERVAGACVVFGATLLAACGVLFVLPGGARIGARLWRPPAATDGQGS